MTADRRLWRERLAALGRHGIGVIIVSDPTSGLQRIAAIAAAVLGE